MIKISDVVRDLINKNQYLAFGLNNRLFNLTQLAQFLQPMIETRLKREVRASAILMNLSRLQRDKEKHAKILSDFKIENITIQSNLMTATFYRNDRTETAIDALHQIIRKRNGYFGWSEGMNETAIIFEQRFLADYEKLIAIEKPKFEERFVAALVIKFPKKYSGRPGFLFSALQALALQNINVIEASSTYSEFTIYIQREDIQLAFEALENSFGPV